MMAEEFRYSVVMPAHNSERTIEAAVLSVLAQTVLPFEIIVVDDGSTDSTGEIVEAISSPLVRLETQSNKGPGSARNRGIELARREWIAFLDSDDLWSPDHAESFRGLSVEFPNANLLATGYCEVTDVPVVSARQSSGQSFLANVLEGRSLWPIHTSAVAIRRSFVREIGGFSSAFPGEDVDLWFRSALSGQIAMTTRATSYYVRRQDSIMGRENVVVRKLPKQPLIASMDNAVADPHHVGKRTSLLHYRETVYRTFLRQAIAQADSSASREIVRMMRARSIAVPFHLAALSAVPNHMLSLANTLRRIFLRQVANHGH